MNRHVLDVVEPEFPRLCVMYYVQEIQIRAQVVVFGLRKHKREYGWFFREMENVIVEVLRQSVPVIIASMCVASQYRD